MFRVREPGQVLLWRGIPPCASQQATCFLSWCRGSELSNRLEGLRFVMLQRIHPRP